LRDREEDTLLLYIMKENGDIVFFTANKELQATSGDTVVSLTSPTKEIMKVQERLEADRAKQSPPKE
jgi:hypothetical protein